ncbi:hypothetical protein PR202_ga13111 [Eleusine coracana subsp. coracana]|uniref:Protein yippee-like n=1 Tax=Eleusine coracana subsp. coracana TaxID=191504 RepID=A0AAV5CDV5_ELECO|nr:hypothetical protein PR202_ga13111 [Eleusine coracana subsp. coracana]
MESAPILTLPAVSVDGGAAATAAEENADAVTEMAERLTIGTDTANTSGPVDLGAEGVYSCKDCRTHLGLADDIISKAFHCKNGKAYLFDKVNLSPSRFVVKVISIMYSVNVNVGVQEDRLMMTGVHTVSDIFCVGCGATLGWKYLTAYERNQRYKEGKYILER